MITLAALMTFLLGLFVPMLAHAQDAAASMPTELDYAGALALLATALGGLKGATAPAIGVAVTQAVMLLFRSPLGAMTGRWRWFIYSGVSVVAGTFAMVAAGSSWTVALVSGATLTGLVNWLHQGVAQWGKTS